MNKLIQNISDGSISPLDIIDEISEYSEEISLNTYPDPSLIEHDKFADKEYYLEDKLDLSENYSVVFSARLNEYGFLVNGDLKNQGVSQLDLI